MSPDAPTPPPGDGRSPGRFGSDQGWPRWTIFVIVAVVLGAIGIALWLFMAWANGKGKSWARIVATVLAALYIVSFLVNAASGQMTGASMVLSILTLLVAIGTLVMLWRKDSSEFYRAQSAPRYS